MVESIRSRTRGRTTRSGKTTSPLMPDRSKSMMSLRLVLPSGFSLTNRASLLAWARGHLATTWSQVEKDSTKALSVMRSTSVSANLPSSA